MLKNRLYALLGVCMLVLFAGEVKAQGQPIQVSLFNPIQLVGERQAINGLRINFIYGKNTQVTGIDWGLVNHTTSGTTLGWQNSMVGYNEANFTGFQSGGVNITNGRVEGVQWGFVNYGGNVNGVQIGFVNYASNMKKGLQIGLINIIKTGGQFPFFPIVNWAF